MPNIVKNFVFIVAGLAASCRFWKEANRFRQQTISAKVNCDNCGSEYEAWIRTNDAVKMGKGYNPTVSKPELRAECTIKCPSCDKMVTGCFAPMLA